MADLAASSPPRELSLRAVLTAVAVALIMGSAYPYVVLKLGYGPNISVVSAFFGYMILGLVALFTSVASTRFEANMAQTAGTAAGQTGFMVIVLAAIDMLNERAGLGFSLHLSGWQIFWWLTLGGFVGAFLAVPLRRHYIDEENLTFADGTAAGETLVVLYQGRKEAADRLRALAAGMGISGLICFLRDGPWKLFPGEVSFGANGHALRLGSELGVLSFGAGMLIGLRVTLSMLLGSILAWVIAPGPLVAHGWATRHDLRRGAQVGDVAGHRAHGGGRHHRARPQLEGDRPHLQGAVGQGRRGHRVPHALDHRRRGGLVGRARRGPEGLPRLPDLALGGLARSSPSRSCWWASGCWARPTGPPSARSPTSCRRSSRPSPRVTCR